MTDSLLALAAELERRGEPFAIATVVRCERPTSAKPGARAIVRADGRLIGWVGGACAEPVVLREALAALVDGQPRLIGLIGEGGHAPGRAEGVLSYPMACHSGGTLEIYVEPHLPKPALVLLGRGPVIEALATLGEAAGYAVTVAGAEAAGAPLPPLARRSAVVVATHADSDEDALAQALLGDAGYVSLVASRKRGAVVLERLRQRGVPADRLSRLKVPAGLDLGAVEPVEIAVSILAEIVQHRRADKGAAEPASISRPGGLALAATALDPVCGMTVVVATARHRSEAAGRAVYFCCGDCKAAFDRDPARYAAGPAR